MPEWKSWSVGDDDARSDVAKAPAAPATPAAPRTVLEADEEAAKWGTEVAPLSIARVEGVLTGDGLPHGANDVVAVTEVNGLRLQFHREPVDASWLQAEARLELSADDMKGLDGDAPARVANAWNADRLQPTVFPVGGEDGWALVLATRFFVDKGMSDRQIHAMIRRSIVVTSQAVAELGERLEAARA